jgi:hypothetical protein
MSAKRRRGSKAKRRSPKPADRTRGPSQPDLLGEVRRAIDDGNPLSLLSYVSSLLCVTDPRSRDPFTKDQPEQISLEELVRAFLEIRTPEMTALLAVIAELAPRDDVLRRRIRRELASRPKVEPHWIAELAQSVTHRAVRMSHILGDGDDVILGSRLPGGQQITEVVYIDHNLGTIVKDCFVVPVPIDVIVDELRRSTDDPDARFDDISLADARACIEEAIARAAITYPPEESESWPASRALVEWILQDLPEGGTEYQRPEWDSDARAGLAERFFASSHGAKLDDADRRRLLDSLLWYGTDYGTGDPLRWSVPKVEILLRDWIPRKIVADAAYLAGAPALLRAFIRFAHAEVGIRDELTIEAVATVDLLEPEFQDTIRSDRPQGPYAILEALGLDTGAPDWSTRGAAGAQYWLDVLSREVGGSAQLDSLDTEPLPDEPFDSDGIPDDIGARVGEILGLTDRCCDEMLGTEYRTASRRLLARAATGDPDLFRRKGRPDTAAAAVVWIIGKANGLFALWGRGLLVKDVLGHFGIRKGSVSQRAATILKAAGCDCDTYDLRLGSPDYLVADRRRRIIELRDEYRLEAGAR